MRNYCTEPAVVRSDTRDELEAFLVAVEGCNLPFVSVIMPVRNEAAFVTRSLGAVLTQDYPTDRMEVIVADGMSTDGTRDIVQALQAEYPNLRLLDNPGKIVSTGLNAALDAACGEIQIRVDGHSEVAPDFVRQNVLVMQEHPEAWSVGGPIIHQACSNNGKAIAIAMAHPIGVGNALHHFAGYEGWSEGVPFPAFRRWVFQKVGRFEEQLVRNQDDEFNYRIMQAGGRIYISPRIRYLYFVREQLLQLFKQYFQYGFWRIPVMRKYHRPTSLRQLAPPLFLLSLAGSILWAVISNHPARAFIVPGLYGSVLLIAALTKLRKEPLSVVIRIPLAMAIMHSGYALGILYGLWAIVFKREAWDGHIRMASLSR
jgi:succinoglycan biosynthesis protein ExoA